MTAIRVAAWAARCAGSIPAMTPTIKGELND